MPRTPPHRPARPVPPENTHRGPPGAPSYTAVLHAQHASRTFDAAVLGRPSYGTVFLSLTLTGTTDSYTSASALITLLGLTAALVGTGTAAVPAAAAALLLGVAGTATKIAGKPPRPRPSEGPGAHAVSPRPHAKETTVTEETVGEQTPTGDGADPAEFWDARYAESDRIWSGDPNTVLVRETAALPPGTALDLGCGEGADAVWLAGRGWRVTATDVSRVALERAVRHAADAGVADRVDLQRHDLAVSFPAGTYDLVSAQFLHSPAPLPREEVLRAAAAAVAPGGTLLITGHAGLPPWEQHEHEHGHDHHDVDLPTPEEVLASLRLPDGEWEVQLAEEHPRVQNGPDGKPATRTDNVLKLRRL
ncbi:class I SAM-dependent methyltransferase [Actinomadura litoris]|uniref:class I SAM-dependent methyltransferase n=1 Tax=Actinomadura litoris TaxID=2678616 RepID=UPI001FA6E510|nr:class I SAM-dependent methyltransferase [Actinomadura litoris]